MSTISEPKKANIAEFLSEHPLWANPHDMLQDVRRTLMATCGRFDDNFINPRAMVCEYLDNAIEAMEIHGMDGSQVPADSLEVAAWAYDDAGDSLGCLHYPTLHHAFREAQKDLVEGADGNGEGPVRRIEFCRVIDPKTYGPMMTEHTIHIPPLTLTTVYNIKNDGRSVPMCEKCIRANPDYIDIKTSEDGTLLSYVWTEYLDDDDDGRVDLHRMPTQQVCQFCD